MGKRMLVDAAHPEETRVVVVSGTKLEEFDVETSSKKQLKGNIYLAKVIRIEPSLQAAFVDYGGNRHGFLAFSEIHPDYYQIPVADREALLAEQQAQRARQEAREEREAEERAARRARRNDQGGGQRHADQDHGHHDHAPPRSAEPQPGDHVSSDAIGVADAIDVIATDSGDSAAPAHDRQADDAPLDRQPDPAPAPSQDEPQQGDRGSDIQAAPIAPVAVYGDAPDAPHPGNDADASATLADGAAAEPSTGEDGPRLTQVEEVKAAPETVETVGGEEDDEEEEEERPRRAAMLRNYKIQEVIKRRQIMLVQVVKEERGNKGAALTTYLSLAGRYCVLMPNAGRGGGISRKITNPADRKRMREMLQELEAPAGTGVILRTAGLERNKIDIKRDYDYLARLWENIRELTLRSTAPALIYEEGNLIKRSIRDLYGKDIDEIHVEGEEGYQAAKEFMRQILPTHAKKVMPYTEAIPLFHRYQVEAQLDAMHSPVVQLRSGGYIVINPTEALVAIDVNSGRSTKERNIEETAVRTNVEAAEEIARQLRLRDLAGLIVIDFIDMEDSRHLQQVERRLKEAMRVDRARIQIGRISHFGLLEMSRQRLRPALHESATEICAHCEGTGRIRSTESTVLHVLRAIEEEGIRRRSSEITVAVPTHIALYLLNQKRSKLSDIERRYGFVVTIAGDEELIPPNFRLDRVKVRPAGELLPPPVTVATAHYDDAPDEPATDDSAGPLEQIEPVDQIEQIEERADPGRNESGRSDDRHDGDRGRRRRRGRGRGRPGDNGGQRDRPYDANVEQPFVAPVAPVSGDHGEQPMPGALLGDGAPAMSGEDNAPGSAEGGSDADKEARRRRRGRRGGRRRRRFEGRDGEMPNRDNGGGGQTGDNAPEQGSSNHGPADLGASGQVHSHRDDAPARSFDDRPSAQHSEPAMPGRRPERAPAPAEHAAAEHSRIISDPDAERVVTTDDKPPAPKRGWWQRLTS